MIKVSIIIPVFNSAHLLEQTIQSVLKQRYHEWEMIIVDDGSLDNVKETIEQYTKEDARISFFQQQNAGASAARNTGIKNASNDWILFLDADDWLREDFFDNMIAVLDNDPSVDVAHCGWTRISEDGIAMKENFGGEQVDMFPSLAHYCPFAIHSCIVRKKVVEEAGYFDVSFKTCGDWDFWQRIARTGAKFKMIKETMAFYRTRPGSLSSDGKQFCINGLQVISNAYSFDGRVRSPKPGYRDGLNADDLTEKKYYFVVWCAGLLIGEKKPALHLSNHLKGLPAPSLDPGFLSETLLDSIMIHAETKDWISLYKLITDNLEAFLESLEEKSKVEQLSGNTMALIEEYAIKHTMGAAKQLQIGSSYAERIDIESPITDKYLTSDIKKFYGFIYLKENLLGIIKLESAEKLLSTIIKDEIATKYSWQILGYFFSGTVYPLLKLNRDLSQLSKEELHNKIGWVTFLQQLWQKPGWKENMFYDPTVTEKDKGPVIKVHDEVKIEIIDELPAIKTDGASLKVNYYIAGLEIGSCKYEAKKNYVYPQMLRVAINITARYELCRVAVREALLGDSLDNGLSLRERLSTKQ